MVPRRRADPASKYQPEGISGPSRVVDLDFPWTDHDWRGLPLQRLVLYELHVGTFSASGDFDGVAAQLDVLGELGINAIQLMPVAQFPGRRNWGYDGVFPFAVQNTYGGPRGLQRLVNACHQRGLAVALDVVYNHLGPEGNYLGDFGDYFTDRYRTPWGDAINFDGRQADEVRRFFIENALHWVRNYHIDLLRLDAIQTIYDLSARPFLRELTLAVHDEAERLGRPVHVIGETNQNDVRQITTVQQNGIGLDGVWNDDFHHSLHALLTGERMSVYRDHGSLENLAKAYREGFVLSGQYSAHHQRRHGSCTRSVPGHRFVVFAQNHDQVGNRLYGERLSQLVGFEQLKLAAAAVLLAPCVPLLFMGEEYGERAPFLYFVDHSDPALLERVRAGRLTDYPAFVRPSQPVPDPTDRETFRRSQIQWNQRNQDAHQILWRFHQQLLRLRATTESLAGADQQRHEVWVDEAGKLMGSRRWCDPTQTLALFHFGGQTGHLTPKLPHGSWIKLLDSAETCWAGPGSHLPEHLTATGDQPLDFAPHSVAVYRQADA